MMDDNSVIFCVHPITEDLRFLRRFIKRFKARYPRRVRKLKLLNDRSSHASCLALLSQTRNNLIIFLCHGHTGGILGCDYTGPRFDPAEHFDFGLLIDDSNVAVLAGKRVIAFCCYSNRIAEAAVNAGASVAIGFGSIRFDYVTNCEKGITFKKLRATVKFEVRRFLYESITHGLDRNLSFLQLVHHMRLLLNKRHREILSSRSKHRQEIAAILLEMKNDIKLFGDKNCPVSDQRLLPSQKSD